MYFLSCLIVFIFLLSPSVNAEEKITITQEDCQKLQQKQYKEPNAKYIAGQDVYGRHVIPADIENNTDIFIPETLDISIDVAAHYGLNLENKGINLSPINAGMVSLKNNKVYLGKTALDEKEKQALQKACYNLMEEEKKLNIDENITTKDDGL